MFYLLNVQHSASHFRDKLEKEVVVMITMIILYGENENV